MKKILLSLFAQILLVTFGANAQKEKEYPPPPKEPPKVNIIKFTPPASVGIASQKEFLMKNSDVVNIGWQETKIILLKLKSGKKERYNLTKDEEKKSFTEKYGNPPIAPPQPPTKVEVVQEPKEPIKNLP